MCTLVCSVQYTHEIHMYLCFVSRVQKKESHDLIYFVSVSVKFAFYQRPYF